jgi:CRP/FNR family transcriptional regulator, anaerobic regulatory protein
MALLKGAVPRPALPPTITGACAACAIRGMSVCSVLSAHELNRLCTIISTANLLAGGTVISEGEPADHLFNVVRGSVKLFKLLPNGRRQITGFLFAGDFLGIALNDIYAYNAEAIEPLQLCRFPRRKLEALLNEMPRLERKLLGTTAHELAAAQDQMVLLGRKTAKERVASFLVSLLERAVKRGQSGTQLDVPMSRTDIADYLGLTTETVSRTITGLRKLKLIATGARNSITILDPAGLRTLVDGADED